MDIELIILGIATTFSRQKFQIKLGSGCPTCKAHFARVRIRLLAGQRATWPLRTIRNCRFV